MQTDRLLLALSCPLALILGACSNPGGATDDVATNVAEPRVLQEGLVAPSVTEAPTGYDGFTNGFSTQAEMDQAAAVFIEQETIAEGLGPVYNAQSCGECHQNPVTGAASQVSEFRTGHFDGFNFIDPPGGSLVQDRAINPAIQERILPGQEVRTFRLATNVLGDGFVEAIDSNTLNAIRLGQPLGMRGLLIQVPVLEAGSIRAGRFGWKNQHASLKSFAADAYLNEMGITSPLLPAENTSNGRSVAAYDAVPDPEDDGADIEAFVLFMRSTKAPPRDTALAATPSAQNGAALFSAIGCSVCHVPDIDTAPPGTVINGGAFVVPEALGAKRIHPYSDFLLHDVGTGDGIVQNGGQATRNRIRTPPLWGLRARPRLMHDGASVSRTDAISRHGNEAAGTVFNFSLLSASQRNDIITFLNSL